MHLSNSLSYIYLHGFASGPQSAKARYLLSRFAAIGINLNVPDLNEGDFSHLTLTRQIEQVTAQLPPPPSSVTLIGSSLGGLAAAWLAERHEQVQRLVLLAPAFQFLDRWLPHLGEETVRRWQAEVYLPVYHYGQRRSLPLHYKFIVDAGEYGDDYLQRPVPTLILHGRGDEVIPIQASRDFASCRSWVQLVELDSDHALTSVVEEIWQAICQFCQLPFQPEQSPSPPSPGSSSKSAI